MLLERELAVERFTNAVRGLTQAGGIVLVNGEAGIGKTTLLESMHSRLSGEYAMLWSGCDPLFTPRPYGPILDFTANST